MDEDELWIKMQRGSTYNADQHATGIKNNQYATWIKNLDSRCNDDEHTTRINMQQG